MFGCTPMPGWLNVIGAASSYAWPDVMVVPTLLGLMCGCLMDWLACLVIELSMLDLFVKLCYIGALCVLDVWYSKIIHVYSCDVICYVVSWTMCLVIIRCVLTFGWTNQTIVCRYAWIRLVFGRFVTLFVNEMLISCMCWFSWLIYTVLRISLALFHLVCVCDWFHSIDMRWASQQGVCLFIWFIGWFVGWSSLVAGCLCVLSIRLMITMSHALCWCNWPESVTWLVGRLRTVVCPFVWNIRPIASITMCWVHVCVFVLVHSFTWVGLMWLAQVSVDSDGAGLLWVAGAWCIHCLDDWFVWWLIACFIELFSCWLY